MSFTLFNRPTSLNALLILAALVSATSAQAAAPIGKVLAVSGQFQAQRDGKPVTLTAGASVFVGDALTTGTDSQAQVRFNDESIIALRPDTQFRVDEYNFKDSKDTDEEKGFFSLVKGGFRTITGLIGKNRRASYRVSTPTSTIGIRGTHYLVRMCEQDCKQDGGTAAASGLYGGVVDGRIEVANEGGSREVGIGDYFYVADLKSPPLPLTAPPSFLREKPMAVGKAQGTSSGGGASAQVAAAPQAPAAPADSVSALVGSSALPTLRPAELSLPTVHETTVPVVPPADNGGFVNVGGTGTLRGQLIWMTNADLDFHLKTPSGTELYYGTSGRTITLPGGAIAALDHDNTGSLIDIAPDQRVENITVNAAAGSTIQVGAYTYFVYSFSGNNGGAPTTALVRVSGADGVTTQYSTTLANGQTSPNYVVNYAGTGTSNSGTATPASTTYGVVWAYGGTMPTTPFVYSNASDSSNIGATPSASTVQNLGQGTFSASRNGSPLVDTGSSVEVGNVTWGRWSSGLVSSVSSNSSPVTPSGGVHFAVGDATPASAWPVTGVISYTRIGGTSPTDSGGNVGTWNGGSLVVDFTNRTAATGTPLSWSVGGASYTVSFSNRAIGNGAINQPLTNVGSCTGGGCGAAGVPITRLDLGGGFIGTAAQGIATSITSYTSAATNPTTSSVQVFKR